MRLALETATDRASVAIGDGGRVVEREITGARRHAAGLIPAIVSRSWRPAPRLDGVRGLVLSDGPGSFTGLRVGAAVAKALAQARGLPLWTAPSLLVRARGVARRGAIVLAVANASGASCMPRRIASRRDHRTRAAGAVGPSPRGPRGPRGAEPRCWSAKRRRPRLGCWRSWSGVALIAPPAGAPHARALLGLVDRPGGAPADAAVEEWEPVYGRPAEAQARWETAHGRPLPDSIGSPG